MVSRNLPQTALLIDWENLKGSLNTSLGALPDIVTLKKAVRRIGTLRLARAYADWADPWHDGDSHRLAQQGIDPVLVQTRDATDNRPVKNSADLRLACDGIELLTTHPTLEAFVIVSGDGDLVHLVEKLKAHGKTVTTIAVTQTLSSILRVACDRVVLYDDLVSGLRAVAASAEIDQALRAFKEAVERLDHSKGDTSLTSVKAEMILKLGQFDEERLGIPTFRHLAFLAEARGAALIDARTEPFRALPAGTTRPGVFDGEHWRRLTASMDPERDYPPAELKSLIEQLGLARDRAASLTAVARQSGVLWFRQRKIRLRGSDRFAGHYRLNLHHPRVQVLRAGAK